MPFTSITQISSALVPVMNDLFSMGGQCWLESLHGTDYLCCSFSNGEKWRIMIRRQPQRRRMASWPALKQLTDLCELSHYRSETPIVALLFRDSHVEFFDVNIGEHARWGSCRKCREN